MVWRRIGAVLAGLVVAFLIAEAAELLVHQIYPPLKGTDMHNFEAVKKFVAALPTPAFALVLTGWLLATVVGTFTATRIGRTPVCGYILGALLLAGGIVNCVVIPQPLWFSLISFVIYIGGTGVGVKLGRVAVSTAAVA